MRPLQRCLRLSVRSLAPLLAMSWVCVACAATGEAEPAAMPSRSAMRIAQQAKPAPGPAKAAPAAPAAPAAGQPAADGPAWAVNCTDQGQPRFTCEMTQALIDQQSNTQVMLLSVKSVTTGESKAMLVRVFHGVYIPAGLSIKVDGGQAIPVVFQKSDRLGVYAALPLTDQLVAEMKRGKDLKFTLQVNQGQPVELVARLTGFGPAYERISSMH